jgi:hypothetical protein
MHRTSRARLTSASVLMALPMALSAGAVPDAVASTPRTVTAAAQHQLVPAYFFPSGSDSVNPWHIMCRRMNTTSGPSTAIVNPSSGPGTKAIAAYTEAIAYCHSRGQRVVGYVDTAYGKRPLRQVFADVDAFYQFYPGIDGIFVDQMSNCQGCGSIEPSTSIRSYYRRIYLRVKSKSLAHSDVVGNPGAAASTAWQVDTPVATTVVVFEGRASTYSTWTPPPWVLARPAARFAHLVYAAAARDRAATCDRSRSRNAGYVYVTDDDFPNPWDRLPAYWKSVAPTCI